MQDTAPVTTGVVLNVFSVELLSGPVKARFFLAAKTRYCSAA